MQCKGTTRSGARCKRDANNGDYCSVHAKAASAPVAESRGTFIGETPDTTMTHTRTNADGGRRGSN